MTTSARYWRRIGFTPNSPMRWVPKPSHFSTTSPWLFVKDEHENL